MPPPPARTPLVLAASGGGHLDLLVRVEAELAGVPRAWVTVEGEGARRLRERGERVHTLPGLDKRHPSVSNPVRALRLAARLRPRLLVTSGAGVILPFALAARALGGRLLFAETMARVSSPSLSGRVLGRFAEQAFVQWPELRAAYPSAVLCRPALLDEVGTPDGPGSGTFVATGTHSQPFDRLLALVDDAAERGVLPAPVVAQSGTSNQPARHVASQAWMSPAEFAAAIGRARYVIGHSGSGFVGSALRAGRKPLILARDRAHREHVDDHQAQLAAKLDELGLAVRLEGAIRPEDLARADVAPAPSAAFAGAPDLGTALRAAAGPWLPELARLAA